MGKQRSTRQAIRRVLVLAKNDIAPYGVGQSVNRSRRPGRQLTRVDPNPAEIVADPLLHEPAGIAFEGTSVGAQDPIHGGPGFPFAASLALAAARMPPTSALASQGANGRHRRRWNG
jgi:hypothetical protein